MSTPFPAIESKPSPWLTFAVPLAFSVFTAGVVWGALSSDLRHLERRQTTTETQVGQVATAQSQASTQAARLEEQLRALNGEIARLSRAVEKLTETPSASR